MNISYFVLVDEETLVKFEIRTSENETNILFASSFVFSFTAVASF